jgi:hypothetical protein
MSEVLFGRVVTFAFLGVVLIVLLRNAYGKRHWIAWIVIKFVTCFVCMLVIRIVAKAVGIHGWFVQYAAIALVTPVFFMCVWQPSRHIPARLRNQVIRRWQARTGKVFDPRRYEIDHKVPFRAHGHHTVDNLRVVARSVNRRKGGREPKLVDWIRIWLHLDDQ